MKVYFLVNKDVKLRENGEWQNPSIEYLLNAAGLNIKPNQRLYAVKSREEAETLALDESNPDKENRFFPIFRVEIPDKCKGKKGDLAVKNGTIPALGFMCTHITITDIYLRHINSSYQDIKVATHVAQRRDANLAVDYFEDDDYQLDSFFKPMTKPSESKERQNKKITDRKSTSMRFKVESYIPSPKSIVKNGLPLVAAGTAFYFGNDVITGLAASYSIPLAEALTATAAYLPEAAAASPAILPVAAGIGTRVAVEVPEVSVSLFSKAWSGLKLLAQKAGETYTGLKDRWNERREKAAQAKAGKTVTITVTSNDALTTTAAAAKRRLKKERKPLNQVFTTPESSSPTGSHVEASVQTADPKAPAASDLLQRLDALTGTSAPQTEQGEVIPTTQPTLTTAYNEAAASIHANELDAEGVDLTPPTTPPLEAERRSPSPTLH